MLPEELHILYKHKLDQLETASQDDLIKTNAVSEIIGFLSQGANVNAKNSNGNTLLHIIAASAVLKKHNSDMRQNGQMDQILDIPSVLSWYKPNPFIKDEYGFTPSFIAAYYQDMSAHAMLLSYENSYQSREISKALHAIAEMSIEGEYVQSSGYMHIARDQSPNYHKYRNIIKNVRLKLNGQNQNEG